MENPIIITSGKKYLDIDAYGGLFAYKKLLQSSEYIIYAFPKAIFK